MTIKVHSKTNRDVTVSLVAINMKTFVAGFLILAALSPSAFASRPNSDELIKVSVPPTSYMFAEDSCAVLLSLAAQRKPANVLVDKAKICATASGETCRDIAGALRDEANANPDIKLALRYLTCK